MRLARKRHGVDREEGQYVFYSLAGDEVVRLLAALRQTGETHVAEIERLVRHNFSSRDEMEPVAAADLLDRARNGLVTVLDVRPAEEFEAGADKSKVIKTLIILIN